jgi:hypothetical protein
MPVCIILTVFAVAQEQTPAEGSKPDPSILKEFTRTGTVSGVVMSFVLVNDKTVEVLFSGPSKYSLRARARMGTLFYVQGTAEKNIDQLNMKYTMEQDGATFDGTPMNIKNFEGGAVAKGNRIDGLLQFEKRLDPTHAFKLRNAKTTVEFKLSQDALKLMGS